MPTTTVAPHGFTDALVDVDIAREISCERDDCYGSNGPVTHRVTVKACQCTWMICRPCTDALLDDWNRWVWSPICAACGVPQARLRARIRDLTDLRPI